MNIPDDLVQDEEPKYSEDCNKLVAGPSISICGQPLTAPFDKV